MPAQAVDEWVSEFYRFCGLAWTMSLARVSSWFDWHIIDGVVDGVADVVSVDDGAVVVMVVVDGGGAASGLDGCELLPPLKTTTAASTPANANMAMVPTSKAICVRLNRVRLTVVACAEVAGR